MGNLDRAAIRHALVTEMRSWDGVLELRGSDGVDDYGRERRWTACTYEQWGEALTEAVIGALELDS